MTRLKRKKGLSGHQEDVRFGTPKLVARYRAERLCGGVNTVIEMGAGAGFQTREFAKRTDLVIAIDIDEERLARARFAQNVQAIAGDALDPSIVKEAQRRSKGRAIVFLDPERPAKSEQRTLEEISPGLQEFLNAYRTITEDIAIEVPPFLAGIPWQCEREYLSIDGELNRLTLYFGRLQRCDISVVALPSGERIEHAGSPPLLRVTRIENPAHILVPDRALAQSGLIAKALPEQYEVLDLGNKQAFLAGKRPALFSAYKILARGKDEVFERLASFSTAILHGRMSPGKQRALLREINRHCAGKGRAHLFLSDPWLLALEFDT